MSAYFRLTATFQDMYVHVGSLNMTLRFSSSASSKQLTHCAYKWTPSRSTDKKSYIQQVHTEVSSVTYGTFLFTVVLPCTSTMYVVCCMLNSSTQMCVYSGQYKLFSVKEPVVVKDAKLHKLMLITFHAAISPTMHCTVEEWEGNVHFYMPTIPCPSGLFQVTHSTYWHMHYHISVVHKAVPPHMRR